MRKFHEKGQVLELPLGNLSSDDPVVYGNIVGVAKADSQNGKTQVQIGGVYKNMPVALSADVVGGGQLYIEDGDASATGTITITSFANIDGDTISVDGTDFVEGEDFTKVTDADATAAVLGALIDALPNVSASVATNVITVTAVDRGTAGNAITLGYTDAGAGVAATLSAATLAGGTDVNAVISDDNSKKPFGKTLAPLKAADTTATIFLGVSV